MPTLHEWEQEKDKAWWNGFFYGFIVTSAVVFVIVFAWSICWRLNMSDTMKVASAEYNGGKGLVIIEADTLVALRRDEGTAARALANQQQYKLGMSGAGCNYIDYYPCLINEEGEEVASGGKPVYRMRFELVPPL